MSNLPPVPATYATESQWWVEQGGVRIVFGVKAPTDQEGQLGFAPQVAVALPVEAAMALCQGRRLTANQSP